MLKKIAWTGLLLTTGFQKAEDFQHLLYSQKSLTEGPLQYFCKPITSGSSIDRRTSVCQKRTWTSLLQTEGFQQLFQTKGLQKFVRPSTGLLMCRRTLYSFFMELKVFNLPFPSFCKILILLLLFGSHCQFYNQTKCFSPFLVYGT